MDEAGSPWENLYSIAAWTAILLLAYSLATMISLILIGGMPETAQAGFDLLAENRLVGLLRLDVPTILFMPLYYLLFLGLYTALKKTDYTKTLVSLVLGLAGVTLVLANARLVGPRAHLFPGSPVQSVQGCAGEAGGGSYIPLCGVIENILRYMI